MTSTMATATAHLVGPGKVKIHQGRLAFSTGDGQPAQFDISSLRHLVCYGNVGMTDEAIRMLFEAGVQVSWLSPCGNRIRGRMQPVADPAVQLRLRQYEVSRSSEASLSIARWAVSKKIESQIMGARHFQRHGNPVAGEAIMRLTTRLEQASTCTALESLRGVEGNASNHWFELFASLLPGPWSFSGRNRRPPRDPVNALLSLGYAYIFNKVSARLQAEGFEIQVGYLHEFRAERPSLACDLIEPLRVPAVDRWVLRVCSHEQLTSDDFESSLNDGVHLRKRKFSTALQSLEQHWLRISGTRLLEQLVQELRTKIGSLK